MGSTANRHGGFNGAGAGNAMRGYLNNMPFRLAMLCPGTFTVAILTQSPLVQSTPRDNYQ